MLNFLSLSYYSVWECECVREMREIKEGTQHPHRNISSQAYKRQVAAMSEEIKFIFQPAFQAFQRRPNDYKRRNCRTGTEESWSLTRIKSDNAKHFQTWRPTGWDSGLHFNPGDINLSWGCVHNLSPVWVMMAKAVKITPRLEIPQVFFKA